jgi:RNA polymerase-binding transcription factor DksA
MAAKSPASKSPKGTVTPSKSSGGTAKKSAGSPKSTPSKSTPAKATKSPTKSTPAKATSKSATAKVTRTAAKSSPKPLKSPAPSVKKSVAKTPPAKKSAAAPKKAATPAKPVKQASKPAATKSIPAKKAGPAVAPTKSPRTTAAAASAQPSIQSTTESLPKPKFNKEGLGYTKDFDLPFIKVQYEMLQQERVHLTGQARRLEAEAHQMIEEAEMGDVQFDDEGGEGDTMVVERERDLALSAQARDAVDEIDAALVRITEGTYGYSVMSGRPIPKERLEAIPWSSVLVEEKVGGIGRR